MPPKPAYTITVTWDSKNNKPAVDKDEVEIPAGRKNDKIWWVHGGGDLDWFMIPDLPTGEFSRMAPHRVVFGDDNPPRCHTVDKNKDTKDYKYTVVGASTDGTVAALDPTIRNRGGDGVK